MTRVSVNTRDYVAENPVFRCRLDGETMYNLLALTTLKFSCLKFIPFIKNMPV